MKRISLKTLLEEEILILVNHFGADRVRAALSKITGEKVMPGSKDRDSNSRSSRSNQPNVVELLKSIKAVDPARFQLLSDFYSDLKDRKILPEAQDIRHFAQRVGIKEMNAQSHKELSTLLMRHLLESPSLTLQSDLQMAKNISEQQRQLGFSVLADKLITKK